MDFGTEDEVMGEDTEGSEEDNDTTDEETDVEQVGTWRRKVKGKGKAKMRELKPKKQAAQRDCRGKGVDAGDSMLGVKTGPSKSPIENELMATEDVERETPSLMGSENVGGDDGDVNMGVADETSE